MPLLRLRVGCECRLFQWRSKNAAGHELLGSWVLRPADAFGGFLQIVRSVPTLFAGWWVGQKADSYPPQIAENARAAAARMQIMFQHAVRIGVPVAFGTDAAVEPHGMNAREFSLMVKNGLSPAQALLTASHNAADLLGISDITGSLEAGKAADVVAVPGNPLEDISVTEHPLLVMKGGAIVVGPKQ